MSDEAAGALAGAAIVLGLFACAVLAYGDPDLIDAIAWNLSDGNVDTARECDG